MLFCNHERERLREERSGRKKHTHERPELGAQHGGVRVVITILQQEGRRPYMRAGKSWGRLHREDPHPR